MKIKENVMVENNCNLSEQMQQITDENEIRSSIGKTIIVHGSIYKIRKMSGFAFVMLRQREEILQCIFVEEETEIKLQELTEESCVKIKAYVKKEPRAKIGYELMIQTVQVLSKPKECMPIVINQKEVNTSLEQLLYYRVITLRNEKQRAIFKLQEGVTNAFRNFLQKEQFVEIHSPKIVGLGAEGGANTFSLDYFEKKAYLAQSPQIYKQMMVGVMERVFEIAPVFRAEKHDTKRHLNEYISVDFEMGYIEDFTEIMKMEEDMLCYLFEYLKENHKKELQLWNLTLPQITKIPVIKFQEAKKIITEDFHQCITETKDLSPSEEKILCAWSKEVFGSEFLFVTHYPTEKRPFYVMDSQENPAETLSFDLLFGGIEITTGGQRIHLYEKQVDKMKKRNMSVENFSQYLMMHKYGMPPHGGLGLGLERFMASLLHLDDVRYTSLFPRDMNRLIP